MLFRSAVGPAPVGSHRQHHRSALPPRGTRRVPHRLARTAPVPTGARPARAARRQRWRAGPARDRRGGRHRCHRWSARHRLGTAGRASRACAARPAAHGRRHAVIVRNGVVLHAPGMLDLGRSTRLASRAQRRALRAMYRCCAVPGCDVRFDHCTMHHVVWWRHGGATDLHNLLPLCHRHHGNVHHDGWELRLGPQRRLTVTLPDGTVRSTGPPRRSAA